MILQSFGCSELAERERNDDSFVVAPELGLYAVADGIGGRPGGGAASRAAVESLVRRLSSLERARRLAESELRESVSAINTDVVALGERDLSLSGLGTTLSAIVADGGAARLIHLGDSRVYLLRGERLTRLTRDHTVAQELVELRRISPEDAEHHPLRGMLSRFVGSTADAEPDISDFTLDDGDWLLLATDGLTAVLPEAELLELWRAERGRGSESVCRRLVSEALRRRPPDNVTVVAVAAQASEQRP